MDFLAKHLKVLLREPKYKSSNKIYVHKCLKNIIAKCCIEDIALQMICF